MTDPRAFVLAAARSLGEGAWDGALLAAAAGLLVRTSLRHSSGRVQAWLWLAVLLEFVLLRPFEVHAVPLQRAVRQVLQGGADGAGATGWWLAVAGVYVALVLGLIARLFRGQRRLRRRVAQYSRADSEIEARVQVAAQALALRRLPEVRVTDQASGPFTLGPVRPILVLPRWLCAVGARLDAVLLHELAHLKRRDHWCVWLQRVIVSVFFFWPPVYWVSRRLDVARELACDEIAIARGGFSITAYGSHLVEVVLAARENLGVDLGLDVGGALAIGRNACRLEQRIDGLLEQAGARRSRWLEATAFCVLGICALVGMRPVRDHVPIAPRPPAGAESSDMNMCVSAPDDSVPACALQGYGTELAR